MREDREARDKRQEETRDEREKTAERREAHLVVLHTTTRLAEK